MILSASDCRYSARNLNGCGRTCCAWKPTLRGVKTGHALKLRFCAIRLAGSRIAICCSNFLTSCLSTLTFSICCCPIFCPKMMTERYAKMKAMKTSYVLSCWTVAP
jgi:hypothetical protein